MTIRDIMQGESKNVEFKLILPKDSEKYIKTIIAFLYRSSSLLIDNNHPVKTGESSLIVSENTLNMQNSIGETSEKHHMKEGLNDTQRAILNLLSEDARLSASTMAAQIGISSRNIESNLKKLKETGILVRHGSPKNGYWEILN